MNNYDVIIIGAGLGGLTSGAKLAKEGKTVLLIEQHYIPGGCATTFKRKDFIMEVGLHELDGFDKNDFKTKIFNDLKVFDNVEFLRVPEFYRFTNERVDIVIPDNRQEAINVLIKHFPKEKTGIKNFFKVIYKIQKEVNRLPLERWKMMLMLPFFPILFPNLVFWTYRTVGSFIDSIIKDEDLKLTLLANLGYYHDDPYSASLIYFSVGQANYYNGGYFIKGGSQKLSDYLAKVITDNNGQVLLGNKVTKIITQSNTAIGIEYQNKQLFADTIIANAAIPNVINLLPTANQKSLKKKTEKLEIACSLISIYIGFKSEIKELNKHYSTFIADDSVKNLKDMQKNAKADFDKRAFVFVDYSQIDSDLAPKGKTVGTICTYDYLSDWENLDSEQYKQKKQQVAETIFKRLEKTIPGITQEIEYYEVATPKTINRYTLNPRGSVYGFAQTPKQAGIFRIRNKSPIKNLYFASAWTNPGGGFTGAIWSGWACAKEILTNTPASSKNTALSKIDDRSVKLIEKNIVATNTLELVFEKPKDFVFKPGQYAILSIDKPSSTNNDIPLRALSIASHPDENLLRFSIRKSESGFKQSCDLMKQNDTATIFGPMGEFLLSNTAEPIIFLVSGIGITPIISMLKELEKTNFKQPVLLFYSNKTKESSAYLDYLEQLKQYKLIPIFTNTDKRIDKDLLVKHAGDLKKYTFYIVGTSEFTNGMTLLLQNHVESSKIKIDDFG
jgi:phytoene dehydrogenase-like protein/ferredoxin-NADP reductase